MESQGSKTGRLLSKAAPVEVVADQGADGSYEIRLERGGATAPEVMVVRAESAAPSSGPKRRVGLWLVGGAMVATAAGWVMVSRGEPSRPTSLSVDGAEVPGAAGEPAGGAAVHAPGVAHEAAAPAETHDTGSPLPPTDPLLEPGAVPLSATTALGVAAEPLVEPVRAVLPAEAEPAPEAALPEDEGMEGEEGPDPAAGEAPEEELNPEDEGLEGEEPAPE